MHDQFCWIIQQNCVGPILSDNPTEFNSTNKKKRSKVTFILKYYKFINFFNILIEKTKSQKVKRNWVNILMVKNHELISWIEISDYSVVLGPYKFVR